MLSLSKGEPVKTRRSTKLLPFDPRFLGMTFQAARQRRTGPGARDFFMSGVGRLCGRFRARRRIVLRQDADPVPVPVGYDQMTADRKSVWEGQSVSVLVDPGSRSVIVQKQE